MSPDVGFILVSFLAFADLNFWFSGESDKTVWIFRWYCNIYRGSGKASNKTQISENFSLNFHQGCSFTVQTATKGKHQTVTLIQLSLVPINFPSQS